MYMHCSISIYIKLLFADIKSNCYISCGWRMKTLNNMKYSKTQKGQKNKGISSISEKYIYTSGYYIFWYFYKKLVFFLVFFLTMPSCFMLICIVLYILPNWGNSPKLSPLSSRVKKLTFLWISSKKKLNWLLCRYNAVTLIEILIDCQSDKYCTDCKINKTEALNRFFLINM